MLYFNRNGVWFTIPIAKDAVYSRELLEKQIHLSLLELQNLKDRSGDNEQMRFEKPGEYKIKSVFGRDDIIINPLIISPLTPIEKHQFEKQDILIFPIPVIKVYDSSFNHQAWDVSHNFLLQVSPYMSRFNLKDTDELKIVKFIRSVNYFNLLMVDELDLVTDDKISQDVENENDYSTNGYEPVYSPIVWPSWWSCAYCGDGTPPSECLPTDTGLRGAYHYLVSPPPGDYYEFGSFYGPAPDYAPRCPDDAMSAFWWNHYSICAPSGIIRTELGVGSIIGGNSWTSQSPTISINLYQWSTERNWFYGDSSGIIIREWNEGDSCHYYSEGNKMDPSNPTSSKSASTTSSLTYPCIIDGSIWTSASKHIYLWYNQDISGNYSNTEYANDMTQFITEGIFTAYYPDSIWDTLQTVFMVTTDDGEDHEITRLTGSLNFTYNGYTNIYKFNNKPVYMFSLYVAVYNNSEWYIEDQNAWYGFIYDGQIHKLKFSAYDYSVHLFETATYISPEGVEKQITFSDDYDGFRGNLGFIGGRFMSIRKTNNIIQI